MKHTAVAALVFFMAVVHNLAHRFGADDANGAIYIVTGAAQTLALLALVALVWWVRPVLVACGLAAVFAAQALVCNAAWLWLRWEVKAEDASCTDSIWPGVSAVSLVVTGMVAQYIADRTRRGRHG